VRQRATLLGILEGFPSSLSGAGPIPPTEAMETSVAPAAQSTPIDVSLPTAPLPQVQTRPAVGDAFSQQAGPDVSVRLRDDNVAVYAQFSVDSETKKLRCVIVDSNGQVIRAIPAQSLSEMLKSLGSYRP
jgi:hypothetical protein